MKYLKKYSLKDSVRLISNKNNISKNKVYKICLNKKKMKKILNILIIFLFLTSCAGKNVGSFGKGVILLLIPELWACRLTTQLCKKT